MMHKHSGLKTALRIFFTAIMLSPFTGWLISLSLRKAPSDLVT